MCLYVSMEMCLLHSFVAKGTSILLFWLLAVISHYYTNLWWEAVVGFRESWDLSAERCSCFVLLETWTVLIVCIGMQVFCIFMSFHIGLFHLLSHIQNSNVFFFCSLHDQPVDLCWGYLQTTVTFTVAVVQWYILFPLSARHGFEEMTSGTRISTRIDSKHI